MPLLCIPSEKAEMKQQIMPGVDFNALRAEITMEQVLNQLGFQPMSRTGSQLHGPCPVHRATWTADDTIVTNATVAEINWNFGPQLISYHFTTLP